MKWLILVAVLVMMVAAMPAQAAGLQFGVGVAYFPTETKASIAGDVSQQFGSLKGSPITADALILDSGNVAGAVSIQASTAKLKASLGYALSENAPNFSKDFWKNFMLGLQYTLYEVPTQTALVGIVQPPMQTNRKSIGLMGASYTLKW